MVAQATYGQSTQTRASMIGISVVINTERKYKPEKHLRHMGEEIIRVLPEIGQPAAEENAQ